MQYKLQVWLIFLLGACRKAGLRPIEKSLFHRLIFLSNCLAPLFEETPASARIVKYKRGPFYPVVQWNLDTLAATGVIDISNVEYETDAYGVWMEACYSTNDRTKVVIDTCRQIRYGQRLEDYLTEVTFAFASLDKRQWQSIALKDKTFDSPGTSEGAFIDFAEDERNLSVQTAESFTRILPREMRPSRKDELFLYMKLLEQLTQQVRAA